MRRTIVKVNLALCLLAAAVALLARFVVHGPVDGASLHDSVTIAAPSAGQVLSDDAECEPAAAGRIWRCSIVDREGSDRVGYRVTVEAGGSCWRAERERDRTGAGMPRHVRGCVHLWQWSLLDLL